MVWWSIATAFTPIAAKLGLPFLLVSRAIMGIGEVCPPFPIFALIQSLSVFSVTLDKVQKGFT